MLHHVEPAPLEPPATHPNSYLTPQRLGLLLDLLDRGRFTTLTLAQAARRWHAGETLPRRAVVLTFDDGCRCFAEHAAPALAARGRTATLFALSGELGGSNVWDRREEPRERREVLLTADELRRLDPGIEIGCHGSHHVRLPDCDDRRLREETSGAKRDLESELGRPVETFCYPWGVFTPRAREAVREAGFLAAAGIDDCSGTSPDDPWGLPRWSLGPGDSRFEIWLKLTGTYRWWRRLPKVGILTALRKLGGRGAERKSLDGER